MISKLQANFVVMRRKAADFALIILVALGFLVVLLIYYVQLAQVGVYRSEYQGRIVDKAATFQESQFGSSISNRLTVKSKNGEQFGVAVTSEIYERAKIGDWIEKNSTSTTILTTEPK